MKQRICKLQDLVAGKARRFEIGGRAIAVVRIDDDVYAIGDRCSHADVALSEGEVLCDTKEIECARHASSFSLETGKPNTLPATQPVPVYVARLENGEVFVELS
ncbi:MAG: non-heme iron oxygenase ferredoxin subunit [Actinomycetota bacterium]